MDLSFSLHIAIWVWIIVGGAGVIGAAALTFSSAGRNADEWWMIAILLGMGSGGSGLLTLAVAAAGQPSAALYVWRATAIVVTLLGMALFVQRGLKLRFPDPADSKVATEWSERHWSAAIGTLLVAGLTWLSFQRHSLPTRANLIVRNSETSAHAQIAFNLSVIWSGALVLLALGTIVFLALFAQRVRRGGAPKLETHWEGIGGGLGGWRMSSSLGYLLVACVLALLFTVFLFHFDARERERESVATASPSPTVAPASLPTPAVVPKESPTPTVEPRESPTATIGPR